MTKKNITGNRLSQEIYADYLLLSDTFSDNIFGVRHFFHKKVIFKSFPPLIDTFGEINNLL